MVSTATKPWEWAVDSPVWLKPRRTLYFLIRRSDSHGAMEYRRDKIGRLITYRTREQAIRIQDRLNAKEQS